jgi:DNA invertase Pin-like site-specific DNA recombinase
MLTVLGGLAEFERELIKARTSEGRKRAQSNGVKFGRKPKLSAFQIKEALARRANGECLARALKPSMSAVLRIVRSNEISVP